MSLVKPDRAALGRSTWVALHATADALPNGKLYEFTKLAHDTVDLYACTLCRTHAKSHCESLLEALRDLPARARHMGLPDRVVAAAWAARFHACVTTHLLIEGGDTVVSPESAILAEAVHAIDAAGGDTDSLVAELVTR
jgi:hypothetical protein